MTTIHPLDQVENFVALHAKNSSVAIFFDLDSTLFCVSPRTQAILRSLAAQENIVSRFENEARLLATLEVLPTDWGVKSALLRTQVQWPHEFLLAIRDYWRKHFFSSDFLHHDLIYPEANSYVSRLSELGASVFYLTGRPRGPMHEGTVQNLERWGFPLPSPDRLLMKPSDTEADESFKALMLKDLSPQFDHVWFFENEPVIINLVRVQVPQVRIIFVNSVHAGREEPPTDLPTITTDYRART